MTFIWSPLSLQTSQQTCKLILYKQKLPGVDQTKTIHSVWKTAGNTHWTNLLAILSMYQLNTSRFFAQVERNTHIPTSHTHTTLVTDDCLLVTVSIVANMRSCSRKLAERHILHFNCFNFCGWIREERHQEQLINYPINEHQITLTVWRQLPPDLEYPTVSGHSVSQY